MHKIVFYVGTDRSHVPKKDLKELYFDTSKAAALRLATKIFGGASVADLQGSYVHGRGDDIIYENSFAVTTFIEDEDAISRRGIATFVKVIKETLQQRSVLVEQTHARAEFL